MNSLEILKKQIDSNNLGVNKTIHGQYFETARRKLIEICKSLSVSNQEYQPKLTIQSIEKYLSVSESFGRILYSEISNYVFDLGIEQQGIFITNLDQLLVYTMNQYELDNEIKKQLLVFMTILS